MLIYWHRIFYSIFFFLKGIIGENRDETKTKRATKLQILTEAKKHRSNLHLRFEQNSEAVAALHSELVGSN